MTDHAGLRVSLGSYLADALDANTRDEVEAHLEHCDACRDELAELSALPRFLAQLTPAEAVAGVAPPETLLPELLSRARAMQARARRRLWRWRAAAAGLGAATAVAAVIAVLPAAVPASPASLSYQLRPSVASTGMSGQVSLDRKPWGTQMALSMQGLPSGTACMAVVTSRDGRTQVIGNWGPTPNHVAKVVVATGLQPGSLASVSIETVGGSPLLSAQMPS
ncbi:MAG: anti-sigma factor [Candidatus Dormibacteria bacterium]